MRTTRLGEPPPVSLLSWSRGGLVNDIGPIWSGSEMREWVCGDQLILPRERVSGKTKRSVTPFKQYDNRRSFTKCSKFCTHLDRVSER